MTEVVASLEEEPAGVVSLWASPLATILGCHVWVDLCAAVLPSTLGVVEVLYDLSARESAWLLGVGSVAAGLSQPLSALIGDRLQTHVLGGVGGVLAAVGIGAIGWVGNSAALWTAYIVGMVGIGLFHPAAVSVAGQLREDKRTVSVAFFFVAGMSGGVLGSLIVPRLVAVSGGLSFLGWLIVPGVLLAALFHRAVRRVRHRSPGSTVQRIQVRNIEARWSAVALVYTATVIRFTANLALIYLFVRWVQGEVQLQHPEWTVEKLAAFSAPRVGGLNACVMAGAATGGLCTGFLVRPGREKWPLVVLPCAVAPFAAVLAYLPVAWGYLVCFLLGVGMFAMVPVGIALAQRMLPHRTHLASAIVLGGTWVPAMCGPRLAEWSLRAVGQAQTFLLIGVALFVSGALILPLRSSFLLQTLNREQE